MISPEIIVLAIVCCMPWVTSEETKIRTDTSGDSSRIMFPNDFLLMSHHHHYHHRPTDPKNIRTPPKIPQNSDYPRSQERQPGDEDEYDELDDYDFEHTNQIPVDFIMDINKYNVSDLLLHFVEGDTENEDAFIKSRFGDIEPRNAAITPKAAGCTPELKTISLATSDDPSILFIPQCTKVERCGGCCSHELLSCQPQEIELLSFKVTKTQFKADSRKLKYMGKDIVTVEKHNKCKCDCKIKEESCNRFQEYKPSLCRCICMNSDEETKCYKSTKKLWNSELCACQCRDILQCSTGYFFDQIECKCLPNPTRRFASYNRRGYVPESEPVPPLPVE